MLNAPAQYAAQLATYAAALDCSNAIVIEQARNEFAAGDGYWAEVAAELDALRPTGAAVKAPVVVAYGMGVDSTAMLVGMQQRGERPDLVIFADTGDEKAATYAYLPVINAWLAKVGFPQVTVVRLHRPIAGDKSLSESLLRLGTLPAPAYGSHHTCTQVWKMAPQATFLKAWAPAIATWAIGGLVTVCVGYDNGDADGKRCAKAYGKNLIEGKTENRYPLRQWGWDREECIRQIAAAGLPVPVKSACFHCPNMKLWEIEFLAKNEPALARRAMAIEARAKVSGKADKIAGLGRKFAWTPILEAGLASAA